MRRLALRRSRALVALLVPLAGCTAALDVSGKDWTKRDVSFHQVTLDETECARSVSDVGRTPDLVVGGLVDAVRNAIRERARARAFARCMTARGYQPANRS